LEKVLEILQATAPSWRLALLLRNCPNATRQVRSLSNKREYQIFKKQICRLTDKPIRVGFGISQPEESRQVGDWRADAVIVGSAFVKRLAIIHTATLTKSHLLNFVKLLSSHNYNLI
jgi:tryptophan synthase alpha subunit